ncbi:MAG: autotransporter-associated beta strand repeat-containing protein, partial [Kiritimatiellae bacterium]|nr:autotransporter-associated beta strand repeat-containing protein [Kiritimatiellia bacterium]
METARNAAVAVAAMAAAVAYGNTGTVTASLDGDAFTVSFENHAHETNSLWVVYDGFDYGPGTNGWAHVERLGTVTPETNAWTYAAPAGWGETVRAIRFILSEIPYDYDYSLDFIRSKKKERICLADFDLHCSYRICAQFSYSERTGATQAIFSSRDGGSDNNATPRFHLFLVSNCAQWRLDYNDQNGAGVRGVAADTFYSIEAGWNGLHVNGALVQSKSSAATYTDAQTANRLQFLSGGFSGASLGNAGASVSFYGAQIYDAPTGGNLLVNLVPMVKDGRAGVYDTVRDVYCYSDTGTDFDLAYGPSRVESADPFFADALCTAAATGPELFTPASAVTVAQSITNAAGGILDGTATLTLTGANDWGGNFSVSNGTLVAAFGQGLAATDCLRLRSSTTVSTGAYGGYGGWNGRATASLGSGAGQIYAVPGAYYAWCAADGGELEVDIGGEGAPWKATSNYRRLVLNGAEGAGTLHFANPIALADALIVRAGYGTVFFDRSITNAVDGTSGHTLDFYGLIDYTTNTVDGLCVLRGVDSRYLNYRQHGGNYVMDEGTTNTIDGAFTLYSGSAMTFLATNAVVKLTGEDGNGGWLYVWGGATTFAGGALEGGGFEIGKSGEGQSAYEARRPRLTLSGKVRLAGLNGKSYGSGTIRQAAASEALTIEEGADVEMSNLTFWRRQIFHKGGKLSLKGGYGILEMGKEGTSRYQLYEGAELTAPFIGQNLQNPQPGETNDGTAEFIFRGGTLGTTSRTSESVSFFREFNANSSIYVASRYGGTFRADHNASITNGMKTAPSSFAGSAAWNYAAADWLTAPAFKKTGSKRLTLSGTNTYACATDVADGTLALAGGENPGALPTNGVVRLTGGTLDLGGNEQVVRGL